MRFLLLSTALGFLLGLQVLYSSANSSFLLFYFDVTMITEMTYQQADVTLETDMQKAYCNLGKHVLLKYFLPR